MEIEAGRVKKSKGNSAKITVASVFSSTNMSKSLEELILEIIREKSFKQA